MSSSTVRLAVYDLSHGMAGQLSAQFLGPDNAISIIPHTGVVVFGFEYFFGSGIQREEPTAFRRSTNMHPISVETVGTTTVSQQDFEQWLQQQSQPPMGRYTNTSYDLLQRNCNNFSHDALREGLRMTSGVPDWVLDVPKKFLSSPLGQIVRPMLQEMQLSSAPVTGSQVFTGNGSNVTVSTSTPAYNPWANIPAKREKTSSPKEKAPSSSLLKSYSKPLFSNDVQTVQLCVKKISATDSTYAPILEQLASELVSKKPLSPELTESSLSILLSLLSNHPTSSASSVTTFILMLIRLVLCESTVQQAESFTPMIDWLLHHSNSDLSDAARAMSFLCLANAVGNNISSKLDEIIDSATVALSASTATAPSVRQAASAVWYNGVWTLINSSSRSTSDDRHIPLICAALEGIETETSDQIVLERRLVVIGRLFHCLPDSTIPLVHTELGLTEGLQQLLRSSDGCLASNTKLKLLLTEICSMLHNDC